LNHVSLNSYQNRIKIKGLRFAFLFRSCIPNGLGSKKRPKGQGRGKREEKGGIERDQNREKRQRTVEEGTKKGRKQKLFKVRLVVLTL